MNKVAIRCTFRSRGYSDDEIDRLRNDLSKIASLQVRRQGYPEAGDAFEMTVIVQFVGSAIIGGVIWDGIKALGQGFLNLYRSKLAEHEDCFPEIDVFEFRFDDIDIRLLGSDFDYVPESNYLSARTFEYLPEIVECIKLHLESEPLSSEDKLVVDVFEPEVSLDKSGIPQFRFDHPWKITGIDITGPQSYLAEERSMNGDFILFD